MCTDLTNRKSILISNFSYQTAEFSNDILSEVREELSVGVDQEHLEIKGSLNKEQRAGFDEIMDHVLNKKKAKCSLLMVQEEQERCSYGAF